PDDRHFATPRLGQHDHRAEQQQPRLQRQPQGPLGVLMPRTRRTRTPIIETGVDWKSVATARRGGAPSRRGKKNTMQRGGARGAWVACAGGGLVRAPAAPAWSLGQNRVQYRHYHWNSISSDHFDVYFYPGEDSLSLRVLDLAEKAHEMLSRRLGHALEHRVPI